MAQEGRRNLWQVPPRSAKGRLPGPALRKWTHWQHPCGDSRQGPVQGLIGIGLFGERRSPQGALRASENLPGIGQERHQQVEVALVEGRHECRHCLALLPIEQIGARRGVRARNQDEAAPVEGIALPFNEAGRPLMEIHFFVVDGRLLRPAEHFPSRQRRSNHANGR